jgi:ubiquinone biosynthesis protein
MSVFSAVADLDRLRQITQVLIKHGFGAIAARMGLPGAKKKGPDQTAGEMGQRIRLVLQELGTTFVKLGQIASTRPDLLPEDVVRELKRLQDEVAPFPTEQAREQIERELGAKIEEVFEDFDNQPLACASVAQVYRAKLKQPDGPAVSVAIKVQRPGIDRTVERDLHLLHVLARLAERTIDEAKIYSPTGLVREFERAITAELDFTVEAQHAERFAENFVTERSVRFPRVYREASAKKVLTLEFLSGLKVTDAVTRGADGEWIAKTSVGLILKMVFEDGFFHADPHPGNIIMLPPPTVKAADAPANAEPRYAGGEALQIGLIDLGLVGRLSPELRDRTADLLLAAARQDPDALADALLAVGRPRKRVDREAFREHTRRVSERHLGKAVKDMEAAAIFRDLIAGALKFEIEIPADLTMLFRAIVTIEGVGKEIYPELDVLAEARPYLVKLFWQRYHPLRLGKDLLRDLGQLSVAAKEMPQRLSGIIEDLQRGELKVVTTDPAKTRVDERLGRRIRASLISASTLLGAIALLATGKHLDLARGLLIFSGVFAAGHFFVDWRHRRNDPQ